MFKRVYMSLTFVTKVNVPDFEGKTFFLTLDVGMHTLIFFLSYTFVIFKANYRHLRKVSLFIKNKQTKNKVFLFL